MTKNSSIQSETSCCVWRIRESAALLFEDIQPEAPVRQWILKFLYALRFLFATRTASTARQIHRGPAPHFIWIVEGGFGLEKSIKQVRQAAKPRRTSSTGRRPRRGEAVRPSHPSLSAIQIQRGHVPLFIWIVECGFGPEKSIKQVRQAA